jgi:hypothetical protein
MYIISALGLRGLFTSRTRMEHHAHPTEEATDLEGRNLHLGSQFLSFVFSFYNSIFLALFLYLFPSFPS